MSSPTQQTGPKPLYDLLYACQRGQRVAIVGSHTDDDQLRNGLYVEQKEDEYIQDFFDTGYAEDGRLLILTGSAGDGKSALLARGYDQADHIPPERVNMDATEARQKDGDYSDRLTAFFSEIIDGINGGQGPRSALAINYGLAVDYFERKSSPDEFKPIWEAMRTSQTKPLHEDDEANITVINLSHRRTYETAPDNLGDGLVRDLIDRFDPTHEDSPFAEAYEREKAECPAGDDCILFYNVRQLTNPAVKSQLARLFAGWSIVTGSYLNPRTIIDNIASLLLPVGLHEAADHDVCPVGAAIEAGNINPSDDDLVWNAVFDALDTDEQSDASKIDPASHTSFQTDQQALQWGTNPESTKRYFPALPAVEFTRPVDRVRTLLRKQYLTKEGAGSILDEETFREFAAALTFFNQDRAPAVRQDAQSLLKTTTAALGGWTGRQRDDNLVEFADAKRSPSYRYLSDWDEPSINPDKSKKETQSLAVPGRIKLMAEPPAGLEELIPIPISFEMYRLMTQVSEGYTPNATDLNQSHAIRVLHSRLEDFTNKREKVVVESRTAEMSMTIQDEALGLSVTSEGIE